MAHIAVAGAPPAFKGNARKDQRMKTTILFLIILIEAMIIGWLLPPKFNSQPAPHSVEWRNA